MFVHAHRSEEVSGSEGRERANGIGGGIRVGSRNGIAMGTVATQDNLENSNEAGKEMQGTQGLSENFRCIGSVFSLSRVIK